MAVRKEANLAHIESVAGYGKGLFPVHYPLPDGSCSCGKDCGQVGKHPHTANGVHDATKDPTQIRRWYEAEPDTNFGIATGGRLLVVDFDPKNGGMASLDKLESEGLLPETYIVETGSGGRHLYYLIPDGVEIKNSAGKLAPGVDIRGDGGYVVAPYSVHASKLPYMPLTPDTEPVEAPPELIERIQNSSKTRNQAVEGGAEIIEGGRNDALASIGGSMRRRGCGPAAIRAALLEENQGRCSPPLPDEEVEGIAESVSRYEPDEKFLNQYRVSDDEKRKGSEAEKFLNHGASPNGSKGLRFLTLAEMKEEFGDEPDYVISPYLARGGITDLAGPAKRSGKTTLSLREVGAVLDGKPFLGHETEACKVIYLTEQADNFVQAAEDAGLDPEHPGLKILPRLFVKGMKWPEIIDAIRHEVHEFGAGLVVVDTLNRFAGLEGEAENNAGSVAEVMNPLLDLAQGEGIAVKTIRHANKSGHARGSTQFDHDVDQLLTINRPQSGGYGDNVREIESTGRYHNGQMLLELTDDGYVNLGDDSAAKMEQAKGAIVAFISSMPSDPTRKTIIQSHLNDSFHISNSTTQRALDYLYAHAVIEKTKAKGQGGPLAYYYQPLRAIEGYDESGQLVDIWTNPDVPQAA
jgi:hypothetical protein